MKITKMRYYYKNEVLEVKPQFAPKYCILLLHNLLRNCAIADVEYFLQDGIRILP